MKKVLDEIIAKKKKEVEQRKKILPLARLKDRIAQQIPPLDFAFALKGKHIGLIAEVKQASPSRGLLHTSFNPTEMALTYAQGGANAISVLTEVNYFKGSIDYLAAIRKVIKLPLLRKDFIFDPYQVYESRAYGADALLLIVAILSQEQLKEFLSISHSLGLKCLAEVHNEAEVERALISGAKIIGINNRDLDTFAVDINTTHQLRPLIPRGRIVVSESGIRSRNDIEKLKGWEVNAVLIGEALVTTNNILVKMKELMS
ncbi:MAG: indole-3-glycerol phosphate synthase TrpC [Dehalococcoidia bacterium]|nr:indole-3-glycerol phosphate synthase TrpC [Dehalococcoidia bacterium]